MGNQYVKAFSIAKIGKIAGVTGAVAGTFIDAYGVYKGTTPIGQAGVNVFFTGVGLYGGPIGAGISVGYFGLNAFYPGGAFGYAKDVGQSLQNSGSPIMYQP